MSSPLSHLSFSFWRSQRLPVLLQTEAAECGLACLSMVASYWGHKTDIASMRRRFSGLVERGYTQGFDGDGAGFGFADPSFKTRHGAFA